MNLLRLQRRKIDPVAERLEDQVMVQIEAVSLLFVVGEGVTYFCRKSPER